MIWIVIPLIVSGALFIATICGAFDDQRINL